MNNKDLVNKYTILNYLNKELREMLTPNKNIPTEARTGAILSIKTIINFIENL